MKTFFKDNFEIYFGYLVALIIFVCFIIKGPTSIIICKFDLLISSAITIIITLIGFLLTIATIFIALIQSSIIKIIIKSKNWKLLIYYLMEPIFLGLLGIAFFIVLINITGSENQIEKFHLSLLLSFSFLIFFDILRIGYFLTKILIKVENKAFSIYDEDQESNLTPDNIGRNK